MKKKVLKRFLTGIPQGIALGYVITILISLCVGGGQYFPCSGKMVDAVGSEIGAVLLQAVLCGVMGGGFSAASMIWEQEGWSLLKQTAIYFLTISLLTMPTAYFCWWMEHSWRGFLEYFGIFLGIFLFIWVTLYGIIMHSIQKMNKSLKNTPDHS